jgi:hypothetical protein
MKKPNKHCICYGMFYCDCTYLNNVPHSYLNNRKPWNKKLHMDLEWTHETCKFVVNPILHNW